MEKLASATPPRPDRETEVCPGSHEYAEQHGDGRVICGTCGAVVEAEADRLTRAVWFDLRGFAVGHLRNRGEA